MVLGSGQYYKYKSVIFFKSNSFNMEKVIGQSKYINKIFISKNWKCLKWKSLTFNKYLIK